MNMMDYTKFVCSIFIRNKWIYDDSDDEESRDKMIRLGEGLSDEEREMMITLLSKYKKIPLNDYTNQLLELTNLLKPVDYANIKDFYVLPIKRPEDFLKTKSSDNIAYIFCNTPKIKKHVFFQNKKINLISYKSIPETINTSTKKGLILIDDFSGSGNTAMECLNYLCQECSISKEKIIVMFMCSMKKSFYELKNKNFNVYANYIQEKGISDITDDSMRKTYIELMNNLETRFNFKEHDKFGFDKTESLITFIRTPNNTFPVFWDGKRNKNAPFERI